MIDRRSWMAGALGSASLLMLGDARVGATEPGVLTLGFQKTGIPLIARQLKVFEKRFKPKGIDIAWVEFPSGLTLLQALDIGSLDFGNSGNAGCIFLQAAGGKIVYVAGQPTGPKSEGILVKDKSSLASIADLKGRKVGYARGSSSHNLVAAALERENLSLNDVQSISLSAADGAFAFENGGIDAWVVWDPYFRIARSRSATRVLAYSGDVLENSSSFLLANSDFAHRHPEHVQDLIAGSAEAGAWAKSHLGEVTKALAAATRIDPDILAEVNANAGFDVTPLTASLMDGQQQTADRLYKLGVIPKRVTVRDIIWTAPV